MLDQQRTMSLGTASLGSLQGQGLITVLRDADGTFVEANGTFRVDGADDNASLESLRQARQGRTPVEYVGPRIDPAEGGDEHTESQMLVRITGIDTYTYENPDREDAATTRTIVNFLEEP